VQGPSKQKFFAEFDRVDSGVVQRSETVLLRVAHDKIVEAPLVQQALSPIRSIIVWLDRNGRVDSKTLLGLHKPEAQLGKYLQLLTAVGYAQKEDGHWVQGPRFPSGTSIGDPREFYNGILANVVQLGFTYMREVIRLTQMVGYFFWANSYFLTTLEVNHRLALPEEDLAERKSRYYPSRGQSAIEVTSQMQRVIDTKLLLREDGNIIGDADKTASYLASAKTEGLGVMA
jgi:hypothetical protein